MTAKDTKSQTWLWFGLSIVVTLLYAAWGMHQAFEFPYVVQDDAQQHVFWTYRFVDPALFPNDLLADYFRSVAPWGYTTFYQITAGIGLDPLLVHKLIPGVLLLLSAGFTFGITLEILPVPLAGFFTTLLLNQSLWMKDDVVSATPVAFVYPLFLAFLYFLLKRSFLPFLLAIALQGLFYPQCVFIFAGVLILRLLDWRDRRLRLSRVQEDFQFGTAGLIVAFLVMLPYAFKSSVYGPTITAEAARQLPAFQLNHWSEFFQPGLRNFWLCGKRSGMMPSEWCNIRYSWPGLPQSSSEGVEFGVPQVIFSLLLPVFWFAGARRFPLVQQIHHNGLLLIQTLVVSIGFFLISHALIFQLHLPNRYTEHSFRILSSLMGGMALTVLIDAILRAGIGSKWRSIGAQVFAISLGLLLLLYPLGLWLGEDPFPDTRYISGNPPALYDFFARQPKNVRIASIAPQASSIPSFSRRSLYVGGEGFMLPYHVSYYQEVNRRMNEMIRAQYTPDLLVLKSFIRSSGVDLWLVERGTFRSPYLSKNHTLIEYAPLAQEIKPVLDAGKVPALSRMSRRCAVFQEANLTVIDTQCILDGGLNTSLNSQENPS